jgi:hypothetical protein
MMAVCDDVQVIERDFVDDDCDLRVTAQFIDNASNPVGAEMVLKEVEDEPDGEFILSRDAIVPGNFLEPLDDEPETTVPESAPEPESEQLPAPEPELDTVPETEDDEFEPLDVEFDEEEEEEEEELNEEPSDEE